MADWTITPPTEPGWYWFWTDEDREKNDPPYIVEVFRNGTLRFPGRIQKTPMRCLEMEGPMWLGPIALPA